MASVIKKRGPGCLSRQTGLSVRPAPSEGDPEMTETLRASDTITENIDKGKTPSSCN
jgi:hypothetical protein